jgi:uncharacterized protein YutE (UPF0331/DUF86 family)
MASDPILLRKSQIIERCVQRITEEMGDANGMESLSQTKQDSVLLNLERACQASIDAAMRIVRLKKLGLPAESREAFKLIHQKQLIDTQLYHRMISMVGFRNTAVHDYQGLNLKIIDGIVRSHLVDLLTFASLVITLH